MNVEQYQALELVKKGKSIFITGSAGTGKSFVLRKIVNFLKDKYQHGSNGLNERYAVTSLTGISSLNIDGQTLHSWAGIGLGEGSVESLVKKIRGSNKHIRWQRISVLIIDEISMMDQDLFEKLHQIGQILRRNKNELFGGIQLIMSGDFLQLPPVAKNKELHFCFESPIWKKYVKAIINFRQIFRQADLQFQQMLSRIRLGIVTEEDKQLLRSRIVDKVPKMKVKPTKLFPYKKDVNEINQRELAKLIIKGNTSKRYFPFYRFSTKLDNDNIVNLTQHRMTSILADKQMIEDASGIHVLDRLTRQDCNSILDLCVGAQVVLSKNLDLNLGLANGSRGVVVDFTGENGAPRVDFDKFGIHEIKRSEFPIEFSDHDVIIIQYPLQLAWATTIHRSQSQTLNKVVTDLGYVFSPGQTYVCLSRVRDLEGLYLLRIDFDRITCHKKAKEFYDNLGIICHLQYSLACQEDPWVSICAYPEQGKIHPNTCSKCFLTHIQKNSRLPSEVVHQILSYFPSFEQIVQRF